MRLGEGGRVGERNIIRWRCDRRGREGWREEKGVVGGERRKGKDYKTPSCLHIHTLNSLHLPNVALINLPLSHAICQTDLSPGRYAKAFIYLTVLLHCRGELDYAVHLNDQEKEHCSIRYFPLKWNTCVCVYVGSSFDFNSSNSL